MTRSILALAALAVVVHSTHAAYIWQQNHAKALPHGDLEWAPKPFKFTPGDSQRYIDFVNGNDTNDGLTRATAWQHHPWDRHARANAARGDGNHTFVFKRGVVYRGELEGACSGTADDPVRLTVDPAWGRGRAVIAGSERVTGWQRVDDDAPDGLPDSTKVWYADVDFFPRTLWAVNQAREVTRVKLARTPNWTVSNPDDTMSEWWYWENPGWWTGTNTVALADGTLAHTCIDTQHLTREPDYYEGALVWTEYGIVMGTPYATPVEAFFPDQHGVAIQGPFYRDSQRIMSGCRYFLEDKPHYLDEAGEFWAEPRASGARIYARFPQDADPESLRIEAGRRTCMVDLEDIGHLDISGLTFAFGNVYTDLGARHFVDPEVEAAAVRVRGNVGALTVRNCAFHDLAMAVCVHARTGQERVEHVTVQDCDIRNMDHAGIRVSDNTGWGKFDPPFSRIHRVDLLRNRLHRIGLRTVRADEGTAIFANFAEVLTIAGNILTRCYGHGIFTFGGKGTAQHREAPLARTLVFQNKVQDGLLQLNDYGAFAHWQGGPGYVYNNIMANPRGFWHWKWIGMSPEERLAQSAGCGYSFYLDAGFKHYLFNNITWGKPANTDTYAWTSFAFQQVMGIHNQFFNNTAYQLYGMSRRQMRDGGRDLFLGNIFIDFPIWGFQHAKPEGVFQGNEEQFAGTIVVDPTLAQETEAFAHNIFAGAQATNFAILYPQGPIYRSPESFSAALAEYKPYADGVGVATTNRVLAAVDAHDFSPVADSPVIDRGVKVFVPWSLAKSVGEWHFRELPADPSIVDDDHWSMPLYVLHRWEYWKAPRYVLHIKGAEKGDFVAGPCENWVKGALRLDGVDDYLVATDADMKQPYTYTATRTMQVMGPVGTQEYATAEGKELWNPDVDIDSFIVEAYLKVAEGGAGLVIGKMDDNAGYRLSLDAQGHPVMQVKAGGTVATATGEMSIGDAQWRHLLVEVDRAANAIRMWIDGKTTPVAMTGEMPAGSLYNGADLLVGGGPGEEHLAGNIEFMRLARSSFAESDTTAEELYAWEFDGPQLRDFTGRPAVGARDAGALEFRAP